jgi:hypothetical protein
MSAEILAAVSVVMLFLGSVAVLGVMVALTFHLARDGWLTRAVRVPVRKPAPRHTAQTRSIRTAA